MGYDIIGDIHGQADKLEALLKRLGYERRLGLWRHPSRTAIFVGDFIDRGPRQLDTVAIVRRMVEEGAAKAVMGNHELNAIAWATPHPSGNGEYLRPHNHPKWGVKNRNQHAKFLEAVERQAELHRDLVKWFMTLPLWLELQELRVVHACWHPRFMDWLAPFLTEHRQLRAELLEPATTEPEDDAAKDNAEPSIFKAVEALTKGIEIPLPAPHSFRDKDQIERNRVRIRWWDVGAADYPSAAMLGPEICDELPGDPIPEHARIAPPTDKPIFFGHYWFTGTPKVLVEHAACVDYSAGKDGPLVAYRWDGENRLTNAAFVSSD